MVMCVKYRKQMLKQVRYRQTLVETLREIGKRYWYEIEEVGTDGDHVHVFVGAGGRWAPSRIMQVLKSISAREMFGAHPEIRRVLWGGEFWSDGGYIGTVGGGHDRRGRQEVHSETRQPSRKSDVSATGVVPIAGQIPRSLLRLGVSFRRVL
jgi:putative transposase